MKLAALSIGVSKAGSLAHLPGAIEGAKLFEAWARSRKYKTTCIVDDKKPLTVQQIAKAVEKIIQTGPDRLLIYFSGHGAQASANTAYWLLSDWENDSNEAINVSLSLSNAKRSGVSQIAVFADACRNTVPDVQSIGGQSIFPKKVMSNKLPQWDHFFASRLGEVAQEVPAKKNIKAFGIFSACLMSALEGKASDALAILEPGGPLCLTSDSLADFIEREVPLQSGKTPGAVLQEPEVTSGWRRPNDIYMELPQPAAPLPRKLGSKKAAAKNMFPRGASRPDLEDSLHPQPVVRRRSAKDLRALKEIDIAKQAATRNLKRRAANLEKASGRVSFETQMGLSVLGEPVDRAVTQPQGRIELLREGKTTHLRCFGSDALTILIKLKSGNWIGTACFPGLIGTILVEKGLAMSTAYVPSVNSNLGQQDMRPMREVMARWMALSQQGMIPQKQELIQFADNVRQWKHVNPSLGILAAYAYERVGKLQELKSLSGYYAELNQAVPFDVAYLPSLPIKKVPPDLVVTTVLNGIKKKAKVAGHFPLMTQGWAFLDRDDRFLNSKLFEIRKGLNPRSLWTTLREAEGQQLADLVAGGKT
jgi:Caspase domain